MDNLLINNSFKEFFFHLIILFLISISAFLKINNYFDLLLIAGLIIFARNKSQLFSYYPLALFMWGLYSDVLIGFPFGYSGVIFLFFFFLKEFATIFSNIENVNVRFYIYAFGLIIFLLFEYLAIWFFFNVSLSKLNILTKYFLILLIFYPIAKIFMYIEIYNEK
tara:strand:- start:89 stop:583 length:495 start_codon:yes stop_codon:yes gene_type:complete